MIQTRLQAAAAFLCLLPSVWAQAPAPKLTRPEFEVASIKLDPSGGRGGRIEMPPGGRFNLTNVPLQFLITFGYNIKDNQIAGAPSWLNTDRYDVAARADGNASQDQLRLMAQSLLADRMKLAMHHETRELTVYELTPAKGGLKLTPSTESNCTKFDRDHPPPPPTPGGPMPNICGNVGMTRGLISAYGVPITRLVDLLSNLLGRPVVDKTGASGTYNLRVEFTPDQATGDGPFGAGGPGGPGGDAPPPDSASPNIFTALQEQLGIKADSAKGQVEMLVIDHVERPSEN
jgi:bla regulator protein blaR1